ncbi:MAG: hypothetical protein FWD11_02755 [Micrococcales bacterium]|nr:hypothetical protein [Micrococcales bacterium]
MTAVMPSGLPEETERTVMVLHGMLPAAPDTTTHLDDSDLDDTDIDDTDRQSVVARPLRALIAPNPLAPPPSAPVPAAPLAPAPVPPAPALPPGAVLVDDDVEPTIMVSLSSQLEDTDEQAVISRPLRALMAPPAPVGPPPVALAVDDDVESTLMVSREPRGPGGMTIPSFALAPAPLPPTAPLHGGADDDVERTLMVSRSSAPPPGHLSSGLPSLLARGPAPVPPAAGDDDVERTVMVSRVPRLPGGVPAPLAPPAPSRPPVGAPPGMRATQPLTEGTVVVPRATGPATDGTIIVPRAMGPATDGTIIVPRNVGPPTDGTIVVPRTLGPPTDGTIMVAAGMGRSGLLDPVMRGPGGTFALPQVVPVPEERPRYIPRPVPVIAPPLQVLEGPTVGRGTQRLASIALASRRSARVALAWWVVLCGVCATAAYVCFTQLFG